MWPTLALPAVAVAIALLALGLNIWWSKQDRDLGGR
jgi:hypothetical protein